MLLFLVPLRSPESTKNWGHVSRLAVRALRSMCAQTSPEFRVILVCNRAPEGIFEHPNLIVIEEPFPIPTPEYIQRMIDKFRKLQRAMIEGRRFGPCHIMFADADDCVSRRLAAVSTAQPEANGWYFERGYVYDEGSRFLVQRKDFDLFCGTSTIVRCALSEMPQSMKEPQENFFLLTHAHPIVRESMRKRGTPLEPLPFQAPFM